MAKIQLVIEIEERLYKNIIDNDKDDEEFEAMDMAFCDAKPFPKGHGRLKDVDAFISKVQADRKHSAYSRSWTADDVLTALDNSYAPTIIEADKEG